MLPHLLCITAGVGSVPAGGNVLQSLLQQSSAASQAAAAAAAGNNSARQLQLEVLQMPDDALINRIVAQTAAQPGTCVTPHDWPMCNRAEACHVCCMSNRTIWKPLDGIGMCLPVAATAWYDVCTCYIIDGCLLMHTAN
jgi:hypothetical protein